ncbi:DUF4129 domain-containing protein [Bacillus rubiinfantis]|uniref:DUF4129 domain-containing protein n=1 Tax=Bacillus rubiinfantis TaxID=1499680 RepID=UPI0005A9DDEB|nr:DUF4129 domain-containing protein [Bacillus rubiinfantis]
MLDDLKARDELKDILNQKEYRVYHEAKGLLATWWEQAKQWLSEKLQALFPALKVSDSAAGSVLIIVIVIVLLLLALSTFLLLRNHKRNRLLRKQKPLQSRQELDWTYTQHLREAGRLEAGGDYRSAVRHLFLGLLLFFHEKGWLEARIWKTNWEYYEELSKVGQAHAQQFYYLARFFDEVTYGEQVIDKAEYDEFVANIKKQLQGEEWKGGEWREKG